MQSAKGFGVHLTSPSGHSTRMNNPFRTSSKDATSNEKLLVAPGIATSSKDATSSHRLKTWASKRSRTFQRIFQDVLRHLHAVRSVSGKPESDLFGAPETLQRPPGDPPVTGLRLASRPTHRLGGFSTASRSTYHHLGQAELANTAKKVQLSKCITCYLEQEATRGSWHRY